MLSQERTFTLPRKISAQVVEDVRKQQRVRSLKQRTFSIKSMGSSSISESPPNSGFGNQFSMSSNDILIPNEDVDMVKRSKTVKKSFALARNSEDESSDILSDISTPKMGSKLYQSRATVLASNLPSGPVVFQNTLSSSMSTFVFRGSPSFSSSFSQKLDHIINDQYTAPAPDQPARVIHDQEPHAIMDWATAEGTPAGQTIAQHNIDCDTMLTNSPVVMIPPDVMGASAMFGGVESEGDTTSIDSGVNSWSQGASSPSSRRQTQYVQSGKTTSQSTFRPAGFDSNFNLWEMVERRVTNVNRGSKGEDRSQQGTLKMAGISCCGPADINDYSYRSENRQSDSDSSPGGRGRGRLSSYEGSGSEFYIVGKGYDSEVDYTNNNNNNNKSKSAKGINRSKSTLRRATANTSAQRQLADSGFKTKRRNVTPVISTPSVGIRSNDDHSANSQMRPLTPSSAPGSTNVSRSQNNYRRPSSRAERFGSRASASLDRSVGGRSMEANKLQYQRERSLMNKEKLWSLQMKFNEKKELKQQKEASNRGSSPVGGRSPVSAKGTGRRSYSCGRASYRVAEAMSPVHRRGTSLKSPTNNPPLDFLRSPKPNALSSATAKRNLATVNTPNWKSASAESSSESVIKNMSPSRRNDNYLSTTTLDNGMDMIINTAKSSSKTYTVVLPPPDSTDRTSRFQNQDSKASPSQSNSRLYKELMSQKLGELMRTDSIQQSGNLKPPSIADWAQSAAEQLTIDRNLPPAGSSSTAGMSTRGFNRAGTNGSSGSPAEGKVGTRNKNESFKFMTGEARVPMTGSGSDLSSGSRRMGFLESSNALHSALSESKKKKTRKKMEVPAWMEKPKADPIRSHKRDSADAIMMEMPSLADSRLITFSDDEMSLPDVSPLRFILSNSNNFDDNNNITKENSVSSSEKSQTTNKIGEKGGSSKLAMSNVNSSVSSEGDFEFKNDADTESTSVVRRVSVASETAGIPEDNKVLVSRKSGLVSMMVPPEKQKGPGAAGSQESVPNQKSKISAQRRSTMLATDADISTMLNQDSYPARLMTLKSKRTAIARKRFEKGVFCSGVVKGPKGIRLMNNFNLKFIASDGEMTLVLTRQKKTKTYDVMTSLLTVDCRETLIPNLRTWMSDTEFAGVMQSFQDVEDAAQKIAMCTFEGHSLPVLIIFENEEDRNDFIELLGILLKAHRPDFSSVQFYLSDSH